MSEFDSYLEALRAELEVNPRRADEICAEVRGHLEARAHQLEEAGLSPGKAIAEALRSFGDAREVAARLAAANRRHRSVGAFRLVFSFTVAFGGMLVAFALLEGNAPFLASMTQHLTEYISPMGAALWALVMALLTAPAALVAGMFAGRRRWWIAGTPPALWGLLLCVLFGIYKSMVGRPVEWDEVVGGGVLLLVCGPLLAAFGLLGARLSERRIGAAIVGLVGVGYVAVFGVMALLLQVSELVGLLAVIAIFILVAGVLATVPMWTTGRRWRSAAIVSSAACAVCVLAMIGIVDLSTHGSSVDFQPVRAWAWLIAGEVILALAAAAVVLALRRGSKRGAGGTA